MADGDVTGGPNRPPLEMAPIVKEQERIGEKQEVWNPIAKAREKKKHIKEKTAESNTGLMIFLTMGRYAINLAADTEPNPEVRREKRKDLRKRWSAYSAELGVRV